MENLSNSLLLLESAHEMLELRHLAESMVSDLKEDYINSIADIRHREIVSFYPDFRSSRLTITFPKDFHALISKKCAAMISKLEDAIGERTDIDGPDSDGDFAYSWYLEPDDLRKVVDALRLDGSPTLTL